MNMNVQNPGVTSISNALMNWNVSVAQQANMTYGGLIQQIAQYSKQQQG